MTASRRRWVYALVIAWTAVLVAFAFRPAGGSDATVPEHRSVVQAQPIVDRGVAEAIGAAGPDVAVMVTGYRLRSRCDVAQFRNGGDFVRVARLHTAPGSERALLLRMSESFTDRYTVRGPNRSGSFTVRLPDFVTLRAAPEGGDRPGAAGGGVVQVTASTGCRPIDTPVATFHAAPTDSDREHLAPALQTLGVTAPAWTTHQVSCPGGGTVRTVEATAPFTGTRELAAPPGIRTIVARPDLVAYRDGRASVVASRTGDTLTVTSTVDCAG